MQSNRGAGECKETLEQLDTTLRRGMCSWQIVTDTMFNELIDDRRRHLIRRRRRMTLRDEIGWATTHRLLCHMTKHHDNDFDVVLCQLRQACVCVIGIGKASSNEKCEYPFYKLIIMSATRLGYKR